MANYINRKELTKVIINDLKKGELSQELKEFVFLFIERIGKKSSYLNYPPHIKEAMNFNSYLNFTKYWKGFNPEKGDAYSYITRSIENGFVAIIKKYQKNEFNTLYFFEENDLEYLSIDNSELEDNIDWIKIDRNYNYFYDYNEFIEFIFQNINSFNLSQENIINVIKKIDYSSKMKNLLLKDKTFQCFLKKLSIEEN